jgi:hypothetical protein
LNKVWARSFNEIDGRGRLESRGELGNIIEY